jgi:hypothetical protein
MEKIQEKTATKFNGFLMLFVLIALIVLEVYLLVTGIRTENNQILWIFIPMIFVITLISSGFSVVQPNDSRVLILFGKYT